MDSVLPANKKPPFRNKVSTLLKQKLGEQTFVCTQKLKPFFLSRGVIQPKT